MDLYANIRRAYLTVSKISSVVTTDLIKGKIEDRNDGLVSHILQVLKSLKFESDEISEDQFMREVARAEKHVVISFVNLLFNT